MEIPPDTAFWLTRAWAEKLSSWQSAVAVVVGLCLAVIGVLGYWGKLAKEEFTRRNNDPEIVDQRGYMRDGKLIVEIHPHGGRMFPFEALVPIAESAHLESLFTGPPGVLPSVSLSLGLTAVERSGKYRGFRVEQPVDQANSAYVVFNSAPSQIIFGSSSGPMRVLVPTKVPQ